MSAPSRIWIPLLALMALVSQLSVNMVRPATTYKVDAMGGDTTLVGVIAATYALLPLFSAMALGQLVRRLSTLAGLMALGMLVKAIGAGVIALSPTSWGLVAGTAALGFGQLVFVIGGQSAVSRASEDSTVDSGFGWFTAGVSVGQMLGPLAAGWIISTSSSDSEATMQAINVSIWIGGVVTLPATVFLLLTLFAGRHKRERKKVRRGQGGFAAQGKVSIGQILRQSRVGSHVVASSALIALTDILVTFVPLIGQDAGLSPAAVGALLAIRGIGSLASRLLLGYLTARIRRETLLIVSLFVSAACFGALPPLVVDTGAVAASMLMFVGGFFLGLGQPLTMSIITLAVPVHWRSPALALRLVGNRIGQVVIPLLAGTAAAPAGPAGALWVGGAVLLLSAAEQTKNRPQTDRGGD